MVDFEKCFDSIEISSVDRILEYFNFGPNLRDYVKVLFSEFSLCILNNGYTSEHFQVTHGLLQGNPVASYLYLLTGQILNDRITNNHKIKGIKINNEEIKSIQFSDDLNMPLMFDQESLSEAVKELWLFRSQVGLKINLDKSRILRLGALKDSTCILNSHGIPWTNESITILGINIMDDDKMEEENINCLIPKMKSVCDAWKVRDLSIIGKVLVINSLVMSLLVYRLAVIPCLSDSTIKKINKLWSDFIWGRDKRPKISWKILTAKKENGGLNLSDKRIRDLSLKIQ